MGKISPVSSKYIVHTSIEIEGVVDKPDVIGAIFGQTEGLLGSELELRELQRSGRIGRIEVNTETKNGKTIGNITIPSSLDKAETSIVGASLEVIQRIGPCNAKLKVSNIEDVRVSKRVFVIERAKALLKELMDQVMPDSQELADEVAQSVRVMEIMEYGRDRLPAGSAIDESDEIIIVEGRADVLNLLKNGFKNVIAMNGTQCPQTIIDLSRKKEITVFVDGDRGGNLIIKELLNVTDIDFVCKAPDGKEVEELAKKEIHKALRSKITAEQALMEMSDTSTSIRKSFFRQEDSRPQQSSSPSNNFVKPRAPMPAPAPVVQNKVELSSEEKKAFGTMLEGLVGTRGAYVVDEKLNILGKVPFTELGTTLKNLKTGVHAVVFDGVTDRNLISVAERSGIKHVVSMDSRVKPSESKVNIITVSEL